LDGKSLVIVGGTSGLGLSAARAFLREGARVVAVGRDERTAAAAAEALGEAGPGKAGHGAAAPRAALVITGDARLPETAVQAIRECRRIFGGFHGLYHVAGGSGRAMGDGPLHEVSDDAVPETLSLNLHSVIYSNRAAVQDWLAAGQGGAILNLGSVLGAFPSPRYFSTHVYAAAKAGIVGFSRSIAARYAARDIRVNVLLPGLVDTPMARRAVSDPRIRAFVAAKQPLDGGRVSLPEDLDAAAVFLLSDGSRYCTGQVLAADGGWSVSEGVGE
jgi:NAD(P)-dependent dehydrogenase (short-subunit alcohol dehydrogenase family)